MKGVPVKPNKDDVYQTFKVWKTMPSVAKKVIRDAADAKALDKEGLSLDDLETFELASITTKTQFSEKFGVDRDTLTAWERKMYADGEHLNAIREWGQKLSQNVYMALYRKTVRTGDAKQAEAWAELIDGHSKKTRVQHEFTPIGDITIVPARPREPKNENPEKLRA